MNASVNIEHCGASLSKQSRAAFFGYHSAVIVQQSTNFATSGRLRHGI